MARFLKVAALCSVALTVLFSVCHCSFETSIFLPFAITFGTFSYHFLMRLGVGIMIDSIFHNQFDYRRWWFQPRRFEAKLYKKLKVMRWKDKMPTYAPQVFSVKEHSPEEILGAMCQAEVVHEIIIVLSFAPIVASLWFGEMVVFVLTSLISAAFDLLFVIMQRYNRPRVVRILKRKRSC